MYIATVVAISQLKMYTPKLIVPQSLAATLLLSDCEQMTTAPPPIVCGIRWYFSATQCFQG